MNAHRTRAFTGLLPLAVLALGLAGCQRKPREAFHPITLSWHASTSPVAGYRIYRADNPYGFASPLAVTAAGATQYTDATAKSGHTYVYSVRAVNSAHIESVASNKITVTTPDK